MSKEAVTEDQCAWLIEIRGERAPQWVERVGTATWGTYDASKAIRFCRKQDAEALIPAVKMLGPSHWHLAVTEHMWVAGIAPETRCSCTGIL